MTSTDRFYVQEAHGYEIRPSSRSNAGGRNSQGSRLGLQPTGFCVLDSLYAHRAVACFPPGPKWYATGRSFEAARRHAHAKADELNAWDAEEAA